MNSGALSRSGRGPDRDSMFSGSPLTGVVDGRMCQLRLDTDQKRVLLALEGRPLRGDRQAEQVARAWVR